MQQEYKEIALHPLPFVGRLLYLTRWLLTPERASGIVDMELLHPPSEAQEVAFELTGLPDESVQLSNVAFVADVIFDHVAEAAAYERQSDHLWTDMIVIASNVVWTWFTWLAIQARLHSKQLALNHQALEPSKAQVFEDRLNHHLQELFGSWWYKQRSVKIRQVPTWKAHGHSRELRLATCPADAFASLFHSLVYWNTRPYDTRELLSSLYPLLRNYQLLYSHAFTARVQVFERELGDARKPFCPPPLSGRCHLMSRVAWRLIYLAGFFLVVDNGQWSITNAQNYERRLLQMCDVLPLLVSWARNCPTALVANDESGQFALNLWKDFVTFWDWYVEQVLLHVSLPEVSEDDKTEVFCKQLQEFWNDRCLQVMDRFWFGVTEWSPEDALDSGDSILKWMQTFADCPLDTLTILTELSELEIHVWRWIERFLLEAIKDASSPDN